MDPGFYQSLMDRGFRRSGEVVYRPNCTDCHECVPIRIPVAGFVPSKSQRRSQRRNADLRVQVGLPCASDEKWALYNSYLQYQHDGKIGEDRAEFDSFLYASPISTLEMCYYLGDKLIAVGIVDACPDSLSSVYFYFDPVHARRSLGIFGGLCEIEECRRRGLSYWYLGYYVRECRRMNYKACFRPYELLDPVQGWIRSANN